MIKKFTQGPKSTVDRLNKTVDTTNRAEQVKVKSAKNPFKPSLQIFFGEVVSVSTDTFVGTFYDSNNQLITDSNSPFYQQTIYKNGENVSAGNIFCATKKTDWYCLSIFGGSVGGGASLYIFKITSLYSTKGSAFIEGTKVEYNINAEMFLETNPSDIVDILCYPSHVSNDMTSAKSHYSLNSLVVCFQYSDYYISLYHLPVPFYITD